MNKLIELTKEEAIGIEGGDTYEVGKAVGKYVADTIDFWQGIWDGLNGN